MKPPKKMADDLRDFAGNGWLNFVGGCCGSTPDHIRAIAGAVKDLPPHVPVNADHVSRLSGLEPLTIRPEANFIQCRRTDQRHGLAKVCQADFKRSV